MTSPVTTPPPKSTHVGAIGEPGVAEHAGHRTADEEEQEHRDGRHHGAQRDPPGPLPLGAAPEPPALDDLFVHQALHRVEGRLEPVLELGEGHSVAGGEDRVEQELLVGRQGRATGPRGGTAQHPVVGPEDALVVASDGEVAPHREVDERRGDVDEVDLLVEDRADHPRLDPGGRGELHRHRGLRPADDDRRPAPRPGVRPGVRPAYCSSRPRLHTSRPMRAPARSGTKTPIPMASQPRARAVAGRSALPDELSGSPSRRSGVRSPKAERGYEVTMLAPSSAPRSGTREGGRVARSGLARLGRRRARRRSTLPGLPPRARSRSTVTCR